MWNANMGATPKKQSTGEDCSQEARRLLEELMRILYESEWFNDVPREEYKKEITLKQVLS
jgi:hypothetical protein